MLILVAHSRGWLGRLFHQSVTQAMAKKGIIPLLVLHD
jgi:nucleotide-binding universal stress UspA family protein